MDQHPLSKAFPPMSVDDLSALAADIQANGLKESIVTLDGKILDGWMRYLACDAVGVEPRYREYQGTDPAGYLRSKNLYRRNLTPYLIEHVELYLGAMA